MEDPRHSLKSMEDSIQRANKLVDSIFFTRKSYIISESSDFGITIGLQIFKIYRNLQTKTIKIKFFLLILTFIYILTEHQKHPQNVTLNLKTKTAYRSQSKN